MIAIVWWGTVCIANYTLNVNVLCMILYYTCQTCSRFWDTLRVWQIFWLDAKRANTDLLLSTSIYYMYNYLNELKLLWWDKDKSMHSLSLSCCCFLCRCTSFQWRYDSYYIAKINITMQICTWFISTSCLEWFGRVEARSSGLPHGYQIFGWIWKRST